MTKVVNKIVKCIKCEKESEQVIIYSVNYLFGTKESNDELKQYQQVCPHCNYAARDISVKN